MSYVVDEYGWVADTVGTWVITILYARARIGSLLYGSKAEPNMMERDLSAKTAEPNTYRKKRLSCHPYS